MVTNPSCVYSFAEVEPQYYNGVVTYLRSFMKGLGYSDKKRKYKQLAWLHQDVLLYEFEYQARRSDQTDWPWNPRRVFYDEIKYASVSKSALVGLSG